NRYNDAREMYEDLKTCLDDSRVNEERHEYQYPELDGENKKFTKQVEKAISVENENDEVETEVKVKQVTDDEVKRENKLLVILASIFVGLFVVIAAFVLLLPSILKQKDITVPEVEGKSVSEVIDELQSLGFEVADANIDISDDKVPAGKVVKTNPPSGAKRTVGTTVTIYVSTGDSKHEIQDYTGKNYLEVRGALEALGIYVYIEKKEVDDPDKYKEGTIIDQSVEAGSKLGAKDGITLYIPDVAVKYPDFTDGSYSEAEVKKFCEQYGVTLEVQRIPEPNYDEGRIYYQSRKEGYTVTSGTKLIIRIATAPVEEPPEDPEDPGDCDGLC
ncbi:MAG: PASTA domain-containing protein, partial [Bacilli bacterium]|nr:PASTA domain-containing protein [Bacilli bacterium]